ncbi:rhamnulokinase family protein [Edaphobacter sp. 12200R-103]|uniref:rhamnulokinase n=1 Tax=Edaphobacter sp. 12200R-103 TaxID=2703788 RepID=UPI00138D6682|nr:FGGY-family carbohydrate kinase [Edaphobacter sp. 12200R-103]QHS50512.1 carbohydrate kinase [Edaphobacter sp. 12200R-103]
MSEAKGTGLPEDRRASIAVDLGAESCRVSLLRWNGSSPQIELVHRFGNGPVQRQDGLHWPLERIVEGVEEGLRMAAGLAPEGVRSIAVDGWAVDYVRLDEQGVPLAEPFCYRDERNVRAESDLHKKISAERMREITGVQQLSINTVYQLYADCEAGYAPSRWLNLPEYMLARLGGAPVAEFTNATHSQMIDMQSRQWSEEIFREAGLVRELAPKIVPPGTRLGNVSGRLQDLAAFKDTELIAPACHDTASAIAGIPALGDDWAYISSGTWSLVGALTSHPVAGPEARADNFTNLGAVGGANCFHKNVNGMWLLKQCESTWAEKGFTPGVVELLRCCEDVAAPKTLLDVDDPDLLLMGEMPQRINRQLRAKGAEPLDESPDGSPQMVSLIMHSLASRYSEVLARVEQHTGKKLRRLFVVGGGSRNTLLNRLTSEKTGLEVCCGSAESSTLGNFAVQLATLESSSSPASPEFAAEVYRWASLLS